jgi:hypothetical protein
MLQKGRLARSLPRGSREKALAWCEKIAGIKERPSADVLEPLMEAMDPGEAILFATAANLQRSLIATGDKRACAALASKESLAGTRHLLAGKVLCLETALEILLTTMGFEALARCLTPVREHNNTMRILLPQSEKTTEDHFRSGLSSYVADLKSRTGDLLVLGWP